MLIRPHKYKLEQCVWALPDTAARESVRASLQNGFVLQNASNSSLSLMSANESDCNFDPAHRMPRSRLYTPVQPERRKTQINSPPIKRVVNTFIGKIVTPAEIALKISHHSISKKVLSVELGPSPMVRVLPLARPIATVSCRFRQPLWRTSSWHWEEIKAVWSLRPCKGQLSLYWKPKAVSRVGARQFDIQITGTQS